MFQCLQRHSYTVGSAAGLTSCCMHHCILAALLLYCGYFAAVVWLCEHNRPSLHVPWPDSTGLHILAPSLPLLSATVAADIVRLTATGAAVSEALLTSTFAGPLCYSSPDTFGCSICPCVFAVTVTLWSRVGHSSD